MSEIKVNKISPRTACGTTTLGDSGDTFTIPAGVSITNNGTASGFGATGSASWVTSSIKTSTFTATAGEGYFCNTTAGAFTVNLPAGTAGAVVAVKDYANTFDSNALTISANGSDKIGGNTDDVSLATEGIAVTLVFIDSTRGWLVTDSGLQSEAEAPQYVAATGGTVTTVCTNFKVHTFTGPGTFCVTSVGNAAGSNKVDYLVVAGGAGGGGRDHGGGGGAGGYRESPGSASGCYAVSPRGAAPAVALPVSVQGYPITVGSGGAGYTGTPCQPGASGGVSTFSTITSAGGGGGAGGPQNGQNGGSGGGGNASKTQKGLGNTPTVSPPQGTDGKVSDYDSPNYGMGGGGGATAEGTCASPTAGGTGGAGGTSSITGSPVARGGGGGGSTYNGGTAGAGGSGGGGTGTRGGNTNGTAGTANTGGGGGGGERSVPSVGGKNGGSGVVILRYKFQN